MNNALRALALSTALGACENRPMARPDEICVQMPSTISTLSESTAQTVLAAAEVRNVAMCQNDSDPRMPVNVHMETGVDGVVSGRVSAQVPAVSRVNIFNGKRNCEPAHFSTASDSDARAALTRQFDCLLEERQYFWRYGATATDLRRRDLTGN